MARRSKARWLVFWPGAALALAICIDCTAPSLEVEGGKGRPTTRDSGKDAEGGSSSVGDDEDLIAMPGDQDANVILPGHDAARPPPPPEKTSFPGLDYPDNDIASSDGKSEAQCWSDCVANAQCVGIAIGTGTDTGKCWTKMRFAVANAQTLRTTIIRGTDALAYYPHATIGVTIGGQAIASQVADAETCAAACNANQACGGFYVKGGTFACYMFGAVTNGDVCSDCVQYCNPARGSCP